MAVIVIPIVRVISPPGISERSTEEKPVIVKSTVAEPTPVESIKSAAVKPTHRVKPTAVKSTTRAVETRAAAPAVWPGIGKIWLAERGSA